MARDPKTAFKFFTVSPLTASADALSAVYAQGTSSSAGNIVVSNPLVQFSETFSDATRFSAQNDVAGVNAQPLLAGFNGQNQIMFLKFVVRNNGWTGTGLTSATFQVFGDSQPAVTFTASSANIAGTFATAYQVGTPVQFISSGVLPAELAPNVTYYVASSTTSVLTVAASSGGTAITFSGTGTGTHQVIQTGVSVVAANADTFAKRTLANSVALTPAVSMSVASTGTTFKFVPIMTNNRVMQLVVNATAVTASGGGNFEIRQASIQNGREGAMGISF